MLLLVTRPQPDADVQVETLTALGHTAVASPLLEVEFLNFPPLPLSGAQALAVTSRNALRSLARSKELEDAIQLRLFAVGAATADLARELGFGRIHQGPGTARELAPLIVTQCTPGDGILIHLSGTRQAFDLKSTLEGSGFVVEQPTLYRTNTADSLTKNAIAALTTDALDGVILMSPMTTRSFLTHIAAPELQKRVEKLTYFCLSQAVAEPLKELESARILIAENPSEDDLLALIGHEAAN